MIAVIIPTLNEELALPATLESLAGYPALELLVVDGGSTDRTLEVARDRGVRTLQSSPGRAAQMNAGAAETRGDTLLFLHADTILPPDWPQLVQAILSQDAVAGAFAFKLDRPVFGGATLERLVNYRSRVRQLPYGDQAIFLRREQFDAVGGYPEIPILEDLVLVETLGKIGPVRTTAAPATTSARRWAANGILFETVRNQVILVGYRLGISPAWLACLRRPTAC